MMFTRLYIGTEDNSYKKVVTAISKYIKSFTIVKGEGFWTEKGKLVRMPSYVVDVVSSLSVNPIHIKKLEKELGQKRILTVRSYVSVNK